MVTGVIASADNRAVEGFKHVANGMLQSEARRLRVADLRQALSWTLDALGRDVIEAAREANQAMMRGQRSACHHLALSVVNGKSLRPHKSTVTERFLPPLPCATMSV